MMRDDFKIPTPKEVREIWQRLTPEQRKMIEEEITQAIAKFRRSQFKLIRGADGENCRGANFRRARANISGHSNKRAGCF
jgi:hypothetical protein